MATAIISGISIFINKFGVTGVDASIYAFLRNVAVSILLLGVILFLHKHSEFAKLKARQWLGLVTVGLIGGSVPFLLFFYGLQSISGASASLIQKSMFVFVAVLATLLISERLDKKVLLAAILLLAGNVLVLQSSMFNWSWGHTLVLFATILWAGENVLSKKLLSSIQPELLAFGRMSFGALFILGWLHYTGQAPLALSLNLNQLLWVVVTSVVLLGYVFAWYRGLSGVSVTLATSVLLLGSPVTTILESVFSGKQIVPLQVAGTLLLLGGLAVLVRVYGSLPSPQPVPLRTRSG